MLALHLEEKANIEHLGLGAPEQEINLEKD